MNYAYKLSSSNYLFNIYMEFITLATKSNNLFRGHSQTFISTTITRKLVFVCFNRTRNFLGTCLTAWGGKTYCYFLSFKHVYVILEFNLHYICLIFPTKLLTWSYASSKPLKSILEDTLSWCSMDNFFKISFISWRPHRMVLRCLHSGVTPTGLWDHMKFQESNTGHPCAR